MAPKKDKKKKVEEVVVVPVEEPPVEEEEKEEVQYTDTSYTSASFESLPPVVIVEEPTKKPKKKKKKDGEGESGVQVKSDLLDAWSEESLPLIEEEAKPEQEPEEKKKEKGKGKGKKGKKEEEEEEIPVFEKPPNWKKMNGKEREKWMVERIEQWRAEVEAEKQARLAGMKEKKIREARERAELMIKDREEQEVRRDILQKTCSIMQRYESLKLRDENSKQEKAEWAQYLACDGLPDPRVVTQMATYLHLWKLRGDYSDNELENRCREALPMLAMLEEFVANSRQYTARQAENYNEVRIQLREQLALAIELASYYVLRDLENRCKWESVTLCSYMRVFNSLKLNLWVAMGYPTKKPRDDEPVPDPVELSFPGIHVNMTLPQEINASRICVRASRSMVDLLSESSRSYAMNQPMAGRYDDLFTFNVKEYVDLLRITKEQEETRKAFYKKIRDRQKELETLMKANIYVKLEKEQEEYDQLSLLEPVGLTDPRTLIGELNVELPKALKWVKYKVQYRDPPPFPPEITRTPEVIEMELKKIEKAYKKLALVFIQLPRDCLWNEAPLLCQWQDQRRLWTSNYINDFKFNEERLTVQFRTGVLWPIGLACLKYSNMPYQGWDMRPNPEGKGVQITVTGLSVTVTFVVVGNSVKLRFIANARTKALKEHFNKKFTVKKLVQLMRDASCDFFPDFDAHNHVEGSCPKEWAMERHLYHAMAFMSKAYNFQWSKWNSTVGFRKIIVQMREAVDKKRESKLTLLMVTPQRALVLKKDEMMQELDMEPMMGMKFYPDLFTLNLSYGSIDARRQTFSMKYKLAETVFNLLQEIKPCSF